MGVKIPVSELKPGDLFLWGDTATMRRMCVTSNYVKRVRSVRPGEILYTMVKTGAERSKCTCPQDVVILCDREGRPVKRDDFFAELGL